MNPSTYAALALYLMGAMQFFVLFKALAEDKDAPEGMKTLPGWAKILLSAFWPVFGVVTILSRIRKTVVGWLK